MLLKTHKKLTSDTVLLTKVQILVKFQKKLKKQKQQIQRKFFNPHLI